MVVKTWQPAGCSHGNGKGIAADAQSLQVTVHPHSESTQQKETTCSCEASRPSNYTHTLYMKAHESQKTLQSLKGNHNKPQASTSGGGKSGKVTQEDVQCGFPDLQTAGKRAISLCVCSSSIHLLPCSLSPLLEFAFPCH